MNARVALVLSLIITAILAAGCLGREMGLQQGFTQYERGEYEKAAKTMTAAIKEIEQEEEPDLDCLCRAYLGRGKSYFALGRYDEAARDYTRALEVHPDSIRVPDLLQRRSRAYEAQGLIGPAVADMQEYLRLSPGDLDAQARLEKLKAQAR